MTQSKLEQEFFSKITILRNNIALHDRGVMLGFILTIFPIFPATLFGFIISVFNFRLLKSGKLEEFEKNLINKGLILGVINTLFGIVLLVLAYRFLHGISWQHFTAVISDHILGLFNKIPLPTKNPISTTTV